MTGSIVTYSTVLEAMGRKRAPLTLGAEVRLAQELTTGEGVLYAMNAIVKGAATRVLGTDSILCVTPRRVLATGNGQIVLDVPYEQITAVSRTDGGAYRLVTGSATYQVDWMVQARLDRAFELIDARRRSLGLPQVPPSASPMSPASPMDALVAQYRAAQAQPFAPAPGLPAPAAPAAAPPSAPLIPVDPSLFTQHDAGRSIVASLHALATAAHRHRDDTFPDGEPIAPAITAVVERTQQLFARLTTRVAPHQVRVTETTYADLLGNVAKVTDAAYLGDLLAHPELWEDAAERLAAVATLLTGTAERIVRDIRDANSRATLDIDVAKAQVAAAATPHDEFTDIYRGAP